MTAPATPPAVTGDDLPAKPLVGVDHVEVGPHPNGGFAVRARKLVDVADQYQPGHFPGLPIYPGLFLLETLHQALLGVLDEPHRVHAVRSVRCLSPVPAGSTLHITAHVHPESESGVRLVNARCFRDEDVRVATLSIDLGPTEPGWGGGGGADTAPPDAPPATGLEHAEIRALLPHGWPVLLLDRVLHHSPGSDLSAVKAISASEPCYADVPRGAPGSHYAYPTSLVLESFGQAAAVLWLLSTRGSGAGHDEVLMFALAYDCVIHRAAVPGDVLRHEVRLDQTRAGMAFASGRIWAGGERIATIGSFGAVTRPRDEVSRPSGTRGPTTAREGSEGNDHDE